MIGIYEHLKIKNARILMKIVMKCRRLKLENVYHTNCYYIVQYNKSRSLKRRLAFDTVVLLY